MNLETKLRIALQESEQFGRYATYMLEEEPEMNMPTLRECYKHNASATEYRLHQQRIAEPSNAANKPPALAGRP